MHKKIVEKGWGREVWIANSPLYCGKLLEFTKGRSCSIHYHNIKDEMFYLHTGKVDLLWSDIDPEGAKKLVDNGDISFLLRWTLNPGDSFHIPRHRIHKVIALEDSTIFEFSTEHFDADSVRLLKGD